MNSVESALAADVRFGFLDRNVATHKAHHPQLINNAGQNTMLRAIKAELRRSHSFVFSVAFVTPGALALLKQDLRSYRGKGTIITSTYLNFNSPATFRELLSIENIEVKVMDSVNGGFHAKGYVFAQSSEVTAIVGSSNLSRHALLQNDEWNLRFSAMPDGDITRQLAEATGHQARSSFRLTREWIEEYEYSWQPALSGPAREAGIEHVMPPGQIHPNGMQQEALEEIEKVRKSGERRALVVSATGTGKTILAALAARTFNPRRLLFIAHREQILDKAASEFSRVLETSAETFGRIGGGRSVLSEDHVFAMVQSLARVETLASFAPETFDLIIVDEVHRAGAVSYLRLMEHFKPEFILGLTATPERTDDFNVFSLFDFNVPYEIRLQQALEADMLAPFNYYGVEDFVDAQGETVDDLSQLAKLTADARVDHIINIMKSYGHTAGVQGLIFCGRNDEANRLSDLLNARELFGRRLRTVALSGDDDIERRENTVRDLEEKKIDYILTVDIFNEGIDIPAVNQVVMLRRTQSSIVFTQQLGRGLRKAAGKDHLRVIDFIGNYENNFLIPIALFGDSSLNKDVIRKKMIDSQAAGSIAGVSSVNFQEVSRQRIFDSLAKVKLDSMQNLKRSFVHLEQRLGQVPKLLDFARFDTVDPVLIGTKRRCYWSFLVALKRTTAAPSERAQKFLCFLTMELLNGKRPHELIVLRQLTTGSPYAYSLEGLRKVLADNGCSHDDQTIRSVINVLSLGFATQQDRGRYGDEGVVGDNAGEISLGEGFSEEYRRSALFQSHVDDVIETGLYLARHRYGWANGLKIGERYSRKDACRLLNWRSNQQGVIYGYKTDLETGTCPIFITYHKAEDVSESTAYEDEFLDPRTVRWFTRHGRTLASREVQEIIGKESPPALHVFVKKDDAESGEFYYLGEASPREPAQELMPTRQGGDLNVVTMKLGLATPVDREMFSYLTDRGEQAQSSNGLMRSDWAPFETSQLDRREQPPLLHRR